MSRRAFRILILGTGLSLLACAQPGDRWRSFPAADDLPEIQELPTPFVFLDGTPVRTRDDWERRREEIKAMLEHYQFGHAPPLPGKEGLEAEVLSETEALGGQATRRAVRLRFGPDRSLTLNLGIHVPRGKKGPFPAIVHNSPGTFRVEDEIVEDLLRRGYILASYTRTDLHPDWQYDPEAKEKQDTGSAKAAYPDFDWGAIRVWAWGGSVTIDYLSTLPEVDMKKIACTGHSRGGQTASVMGMMDERVALVAPSAGGSITTGCHRFGNRTRSIAVKMKPTAAAYWYHPNLVEFGDRNARLPFDLHFIKAAVAPRAWFNSNGLSDNWNVEGSMITWRAARVVYDWMGIKDRCAQWYRKGGHAQGVEDWKALADFADYVFFGKALPDAEDFYQAPWPDEPLHFSWSAPR